MSTHPTRIWVSLALGLGLAAWSATPLLAQDDSSARPGQSETPGQPGQGEAGKPADAQTPPTRKEMLDRLFDRLAKTGDVDEANGIASLIQHVWMHSGSDTADLLMSRAVEAMNSEHKDVAVTLLDKIIRIDPDWAEAWNKRATLRYLDNDDAGSMEDISHTARDRAPALRGAERPRLHLEAERPAEGRPGGAAQGSADLSREHRHQESRRGTRAGGRRSRSLTGTGGPAIAPR